MGRAKMKHIVAAAVFFSLLLVSRAGTAQQDAARPLPQDVSGGPGHLPKVHYIPSRVADSPYPFWVDASMVLKADGSPNTALLHPGAVSLIQDLRKSTLVNGCIPVGHYFDSSGFASDRDTPQQGAQSSRLVILGTVTEKEYGIAGTQPGQLLRVTPDEIIKGQGRHGVDAYYVFMPVGNFKIGNLSLCKTDDEYPDPPAVGDQVLLFAPDQWDWQQNENDPYLNLLDASGIVTLHSNGQVSLPKRFRDHLKAGATPRSAEDLLANVRTAAAHQESKQ